MSKLLDVFDMLIKVLANYLINYLVSQLIIFYMIIVIVSIIPCAIIRGTLNPFLLNPARGVSADLDDAFRHIKYKHICID